MSEMSAENQKLFILFNICWNVFDFFFFFLLLTSQTPKWHFLRIEEALLTSLGCNNTWSAMVHYSWVWIFLRRSPASRAKPSSLLFPAQQLNHKTNGNRFTVKGHCTIGQQRGISEGQLTHCSCLYTINRGRCATFLFWAGALNVSQCFPQCRYTSAAAQLMKCSTGKVWPWRY